MPETCANCEKPIGKLEQPFTFNGAVVCKACHKTLSDAEADEIAADLMREDPVDPETAARQAFMATAPKGKPARKCPACGSGLPPVRRPKGSRLTLIVAFILGILPGILYMIFKSGYIFACPKCGYKYADAA